MVHGTAEFARPGANTLDVTASANAIINWHDFSIDTGEVTRFIQPSATSAVLNRVTGSDPSNILGEFRANGRIFLVNPHGIVFGEGAVVDTAGLVASTLGISDADFLAGLYRFDAGPDAGNITNQGLIEAGADGVFLLAPSIENSGVIRTDGGDLVLAAGRTVNLTSLDLDGVQVEVQASEDEALNLGDLVAERGALGAFAGSIRNSGTIEANAVTVDDDGTIRLVAEGDITLEADGRVAAEGPSGGVVHVESREGTTWVSGEVSARASEGRGGTIRLLGRQVGLEGAEIDASGPTGGGEVLVGGDESGEGLLPTAESTYVSANSTVSADALDDGDGGKVVVFAEGFANVQGRLSARGGPNGGDGGFVETSGHESFVILHTPDTTAPQGEGGHWLIDPNDIVIVEGDGSEAITDSNPFESTDDAARLGILLIIRALSGGQTVTVQTTAGTTDSVGHITLDAVLDIRDTSGTNTLILDAHSGISILQPIIDAAGDDAVLHLVLDAGDGDGVVRIHDDVTLRSGSLRTEGRNRTEVSNGATVTLDGSTWAMNTTNHLLIGDDGYAHGPGRVVLQNGATLEGPGSETDTGIIVGSSDGHGILTVRGGSAVRGFGWILVGQGAGSTGTLNVESGGSVMATWFTVGWEGGTGTATVSGSGSTLRAVGDRNGVFVGVEGGSGTLNVENGGRVAAKWIGFGSEGGTGAGTVTGPGSALVSEGDDNNVVVGSEGTGTLCVLDGGLVQTHAFTVGQSGTGRAVIRGVAADGTRSRVLVSMAHGGWTDDYFNTSGRIFVGKHAGSNGTLEILDGALVRVHDGDGGIGSGFQLARNKGSLGTLLVDGQGSSLEIVQDAPADFSDPSGPSAFVWLARRGAGTTTIRNGGRLLVQGQRAFAGVSRGGPVYAESPDPDTSPITQRSVVTIESGGRFEVVGEGATVEVGGNGPDGDGTLIVTGQGSVLVLTGAGNLLVVGDNDARGSVEVRDGGTARYVELVVGANGTTNLVPSEQATQAVDAVIDDVLPPEDTSRRASTEERTAAAAEEESRDDEDEDDEEDDEDSEEATGLDERGEEEQEELPMCPA